MIEGAAANDPVYVVAVSLRIGEPFQDNHSDPFPGNISVAALAEALAVTVTGNELPGAQHQVLIGMNADVDPSGDRQAGSTQFQILAGDVNGGQRRRTHSIQRHAGAMEIERVRDAIGDAGRAAGNAQAFPARAGFGAKQLVLGIHHADVHADLAGKIALARQVLLIGRLQARARVTRVLDRHPRMLQEQTLLGIHVFRVFWRHVEKQRIEFVDARNKATPFAVMAPALTAILAEVLPPVPPLLGDFNDAILPFAQIAPEGLDIDRLGIATAQSDYGDRISIRRLSRRTAQTANASAWISPGLSARARFRPRVNGFHLVVAIARRRKQCR